LEKESPRQGEYQPKPEKEEKERHRPLKGPKNSLRVARERITREDPQRKRFVYVGYYTKTTRKKGEPRRQVLRKKRNSQRGQRGKPRIRRWQKIQKEGKVSHLRRGKLSILKRGRYRGGKNPNCGRSQRRMRAGRISSSPRKGKWCLSKALEKSLKSAKPT